MKTLFGKYILDENKNPVLCDDLLTWAREFEHIDRRVDYTKVGKVTVSTVFLGLDHSFGIGEPQLFETMIFGGKRDGEVSRTSTWNDAQRIHDSFVELVTKDRWRVGLLTRLGSLWIGAHYARHHKRVCINLLPCVTLWIVAPGGDVP